MRRRRRCGGAAARRRRGGRARPRPPRRRTWVHCAACAGPGRHDRGTTPRPTVTNPVQRSPRPLVSDRHRRPSGPVRLVVGRSSRPSPAGSSRAQCRRSGRTGRTGRRGRRSQWAHCPQCPLPRRSICAAAAPNSRVQTPESRPLSDRSHRTGRPAPVAPAHPATASGPAGSAAAQYCSAAALRPPCGGTAAAVPRHGAGGCAGGGARARVTCGRTPGNGRSRRRRVTPRWPQSDGAPGRPGRGSAPGQPRSGPPAGAGPRFPGRSGALSPAHSAWSIRRLQS
jgi:hypothetical protein